MTYYNILIQNTTLKYIKIYAYYFSVEKNRNILYIGDTNDYLYRFNIYGKCNNESYNFIRNIDYIKAKSKNYKIIDILNTGGNLYNINVYYTVTYIFINNIKIYIIDNNDIYSI